MSRPFLEIHDVDDDDQLEPLVALAGLRAEDMGEVLASFRPWPSPRAWLIQVVLSLIFCLPLLLPFPNAWAITATLLIGQWGTVALLVLAGAVDHHRVCEHGLVLGTRQRSTLVVPWSTLDPGRVRVVERSSLLGRYPQVPSTSSHFRQGLLTTRSLAVNGLDTALPSPWRVPGVYDSSDVVDASGTRSTPFVWWLLGAAHPERVAEAVEAAMVADGYAAHGLAERAGAQTVQLRWDPPPGDPLPPRAATDPVLGVDGPVLPGPGPA